VLVYLTYAEQPSGVYSSQVSDVVQHLNQRFSAGVRLVAFVSLRGFRATRDKIRQEVPGAIVLPALPKAEYWRVSAFVFWVLCLVFRPKAVMARNVLATNMGLFARRLGAVRTVCFDGRGAVAAEWHEYDVSVPPSWKASISELERKAVVDSNFRIAVTHKLVEHWRERYGYSEHHHVVIPCTLNRSFRPRVLSDEEKSAGKRLLGLQDEYVVLVYSGSAAGWQSFSVLHACVAPFLNASLDHKLLVLAPEDEHIRSLEREFPNQVMRKWVAHHEVPALLAACDMGILVREKSITNRVASPTKFAEYLSAGLPVLISEELGDYSDFVMTHACGRVANENRPLQVSPTTYSLRKAMVELVVAHFTKEAMEKEYTQLLHHLS
jgi:hypothetical protein